MIGKIALALALLTASSAGAQQAYPNRPIHLLIGFPAGSGADIGARFIGSQLQNASGQTVIVENKPGAGSNIAVALASKAKPDGYTLLLAASSAMAGSRYLYKDFNVDTEAAFEPIAGLWEATFLITVAPDSPLKSVAELTQQLKSKTRNRYGYTNQTGQLTAAYYLALGGAVAEPVSYRTAAEAVADLGSGTLDFMALDGAFAAAQLRNNRIKPLAVTTAKRSPTMPDVPTMSEAGMEGFVFAPFWALYAPRGTPADIVKKLQDWSFELMRSDAAKKQFAISGSNVSVEDGAATRIKLRTEIEKWARAVKAAGVEPQ